jgi:hypothetical protein
MLLSLILLAATAHQTNTYFDELGSYCGTGRSIASGFVRRTAFAYLILPGLFLAVALPARRAVVVARLTWLVACGVSLACYLILEWLPQLLG